MSHSGYLRRFLPALLSLGAMYGQGELATITGEVTDSAAAIMPAVNITVRNVDTNIPRTIQTNVEGYYTITNLPSGTYELIAEKQGFRAYHETGIVLATGQELRSDIKLSVGAMSVSVTVMAEVAPLNTENGMIKGAAITQAEINDMPLNGRPAWWCKSRVGLAVLPSMAPGAKPPITLWMVSTTATCVAPRRSCGPTSTRCRSSRWRYPASPPSTARWPAAS
jgi:Carboxypeptidase regulatory-like domain